MGYRSSPCGRAPTHLSWLVGLLLGETTWVGSPGPCGWAFSFLPVPLASGEVLFCGTQGWY